jgi:large subunit ribosomal protein L4
MELDVYKKDGTKSGETVKLSEEIFGVEPNHHLIYRAVRTYLDNQRQGTSRVKTRAEVRGGGKKPFKQKHTGMARQGTSRSPIMVGGGSIFGPNPRDYSNTLPAGMRRLARKSALSLKAREGQIRIVEDFSMDSPKTQTVMGVLKALDLAYGKTLLLLPKPDANLVKSGRNIPGLQVAQADKASTYDFVNTQVLLIQKSALEVLQNTFKN